ncbi:MAG: hypothetical protein H0U40_11605 [Chloroflexia bacterium]|nr:hypothetical protein [Chloroflexia bacterium]
MTTSGPDIQAPIRFTTTEEGRAIFDDQARRLMNMSGEEFLRRWDAGEFAEIADAPGHGWPSRFRESGHPGFPTG